MVAQQARGPLEQVAIVQLQRAEPRLTRELPRTDHQRHGQAVDVLPPFREEGFNRLRLEAGDDPSGFGVQPLLLRLVVGPPFLGDLEVRLPAAEQLDEIAGPLAAGDAELRQVVAQALLHVACRVVRNRFRKKRLQLAEELRQLFPPFRHFGQLAFSRREIHLLERADDAEGVVEVPCTDVGVRKLLQQW